MEDLNLERLRKRLMLKALNKTQKVEDAAKELGIHERTLYRLMNLDKIKSKKVKIFYIEK